MRPQRQSGKLALEELRTKFKVTPGIRYGEVVYNGIWYAYHNFETGETVLNTDHASTSDTVEKAPFVKAAHKDIIVKKEVPFQILSIDDPKEYDINGKKVSQFLVRVKFEKEDTSQHGLSEFMVIGFAYNGMPEQERNKLLFDIQKRLKRKENIFATIDTARTRSGNLFYKLVELPQDTEKPF